MKEIPDTIIQQAAAGDRDAFREIYTISSGFVFGTALRVTRDKGDAEEVTQDVFLKVYHHLKTFTLGTSFKAWLYRITFNMAINAYNKRARELGRQQKVENEVTTEAAPAQATYALDQEHYKKKLDGVLALLSVEQRACILLREIEGLDYKEIARVLKININTVRSRLKRARERLMEFAQKEVVSNEM
jgi:RNA polymerase sigma-70 factor (ECF subfamily)